MRPGDRGVGICLAADAAAVAVIDTTANPRRLAGLAVVTVPPGFWRADGGSGLTGTSGLVADPGVTAARRALARVRRRLGLPRRQPVVIVLGPSLAGDHRPTDVMSRAAEELARAGLSLVATAAADRAGRWRATMPLAVDPKLEGELTDPDSNLAVGAALTATGSEPVGAGFAGPPAAPARPPAVPAMPTAAPAMPPAAPAMPPVAPARPAAVPASLPAATAAADGPPVGRDRAYPQIDEQESGTQASGPGWSVQRIGDVDGPETSAGADR